MARIQDGKPGRPDGGYTRVVGDTQLGALLSRVHGTVISAGTELERTITERSKDLGNLIDDLDIFLELDILPEGVYLATKKMIKASEKLDYAGSEPDFMVIRRSRGHTDCFVVELKDGDAFDTKKASAERQHLYSFLARNDPVFPRHYVTHARICSFNQDNRQEIYVGFKGKVEMKDLWTGREFCEVLELDYDAIRETRNRDQSSNLDFFVKELLKISSVRSRMFG